MLQNIFLSILVLILLLDLCLYFQLRIHRVRSLWLRGLYWLPSVLLVVRSFLLVNDSARAFATDYPRLIEWLSAVFLILTLPKLLLTLWMSVGWLLGKLWPISRKWMVITGCAVAGCCSLVLFYGVVEGPTKLTVKEVDYRSSRLPHGFNGFRIVQISDLHIGSFRYRPQVIERMVEMINTQQADLIVFTGDLVNFQAAEVCGFESILSQLKARYGVYSILGNHDYATYLQGSSPEQQAADLDRLKQKQGEMGWAMLNNDHTLLHHRGDSITLAGVENDGEPPFSQHADLRNALQGADSLFTILLSHNPTHWKREVLPESKVDLMLSGHTHGMQFVIGNYSPSRHRYPEWGGMYLEGERGLYVNLGIGYLGLPFRLGAWPEITVITLHKTN